MLINIAHKVKCFFIEPIEIITEQISVTPKEAFLEGLRIVQISDLHINKWNIELVESCIEKTNALSPDIILISGDIICNGYKFLPELLSFFKKLKSKFGVYACLGNHDYSDGDESQRIVDTFSKANIKTLTNESEQLDINGMKLAIAGLDDYKYGHQDISKSIKNIDKNIPFFFLTHNPRNFKELAKYNPLAVFAGHTHGGQIYLPFLGTIYEKIIGSEYLQGKYTHNNIPLYVNRGIGTAMLSEVLFNKKLLINTPRFNARPEITLFEFIVKNK